MIQPDRLYIGPVDDPKSISKNDSSCHAPISNHRVSALLHLDRVFVSFTDFSSSLTKMRVEKESQWRKKRNSRAGSSSSAFPFFGEIGFRLLWILAVREGDGRAVNFR